mmetsp:Transcript_108916/g.150636  ORF Transcript_108916/g.150636 Transcript_108916/m.150636 type:complete len:384 (+) Transcript_108916:136-1287(+)
MLTSDLVLHPRICLSDVQRLERALQWLVLAGGQCRARLDAHELRALQHARRQLQHVAARDLANHLRRGLHEALLRLVVHAHDAEALRVAERPLKVVHEGPGKVAPHISALLDGAVHLGDVALIELHPERVVLRIRNRVLLHRAAVLGDKDTTLRLVLALDVQAHALEAPRDHAPVHVGAPPPRVVLQVHVLVIEVATRLHVAPHGLRLSLALRRRGVGRRIVVETKEVRGALDHHLLSLCEGWQAVAAAAAHALGVVTLPDGVRKPAQRPVQGPLSRGLVSLGVRQGLAPVHVQGDPDHALLLSLELTAVAMHRLRVRQDDVVRRSVRLRFRIVAAARRHFAVGVAQHGGAPGLVEGDPVLDEVTELTEAHSRVVLKVVHHLA